MQDEIELKFYPVDKDDIRVKLKAAGFALVHPEYMTKRTVFDVPGHLGISYGRVRQEADCITASFKKMQDRSLRGTKEVCIKVDSYENAVEFMKTAGMTPKAYQETLRETWKKGDVEVDIDTWPGLKSFVEIEGKDEGAVKRTAVRLGFDLADAMFGTVDYVYEKELGIPCDILNALPEITFSNPPTPRGGDHLENSPAACTS